jgi:mono/diheme cytochrome c family protein
MKALLPLCLIASTVVWVCATAQDKAQQLEAGKRVYAAWCVGCHGPGPGRYGIGLTGTAALEAKYGGKVPAILDERRDLTPESVRFFVRNGASVMPFFRKTEITDQDLEALSAYLTRLNPSK